MAYINLTKLQRIMLTRQFSFLYILSYNNKHEFSAKEKQKMKKLKILHEKVEKNFT